MPDARATDLGDHDGLAWNIATWALKWRTFFFWREAGEIDILFFLAQSWG